MKIEVPKVEGLNVWSVASHLDSDGSQDSRSLSQNTCDLPCNARPTEHIAAARCTQAASCVVLQAARPQTLDTDWGDSFAAVIALSRGTFTLPLTGQAAGT